MQKTATGTTITSNPPYRDPGLDANHTPTVSHPRDFVASPKPTKPTRSPIRQSFDEIDIPLSTLHLTTPLIRSPWLQRRTRYGPPQDPKKATNLLTPANSRLRSSASSRFPPMCVNTRRTPASRTPGPLRRQVRHSTRAREADMQAIGVQQRVGERRVLRAPQDGPMERDHHCTLRPTHTHTHTTYKPKPQPSHAPY